MQDIRAIVNDLRSFEKEAEWFEFKENWYEPDALGEYISALSNAAAFIGRREAFFVWGVEDETHEIVGTKFNYDCDVRGEPLKHYLERQLMPDLNFIFREDAINGKRVVVLIVPAAKNVPTSYRRVRYIRIGSSKERLDKYPERESYLFTVLRNGFPTIENREADYQDLTFERLLTYYNIKGVKLNPKTFKKNLGLLTADGKYNVMAQLLSDNSHIPIRVAIFSGKSKADPLYSVREFGYQCILYSLEEILQYSDVLNLVQADETERVLVRKDIPLFDRNVYRETVVNAFLHNHWISGNEPMFTVFSDRIEILSRGTLPPEQTMEGFFAGESVPVNKKLSEIFLQLHISEKTGRGVPVITHRYGRNAFEFRENSIIVTIPFDRINERKESVTRVQGNEQYSSTVSTVRPAIALTQTQTDILAEIHRNSNITIVQIAESVGKSQSTVSKAMKELQQNGIIERQGSRRYGSWMIRETKKQ